MTKNDQPAAGGPFAGVWLSSYTYIHFYSKKEAQSEHYVRIYQAGNHLIAESIAGANRSYLLIRLTVDGDVATGTWTEQTNPAGDFKGTTYNGALQLLLSDDRKSMEGRWVALNKTG